MGCKLLFSPNSDAPRSFYGRQVEKGSENVQEQQLTL